MHNLLIRILACFIPNKVKRKQFRRKYKRINHTITIFPTLKAQQIELKKISRAILCNMKPATGKLRDLQIAHIHLLKLFSKFCEKHDIPFWIQGGTLLGAVRHQGFIPWDDDIDCGMMRSDFHRLLPLLKQEKQLQLKECYDFNFKFLYACRMYKIVDAINPMIFIDLFLYDRIQIDSDKQVSNVWDHFGRDRTSLTQTLLELNHPNRDCPIEDNEFLKKVQNIFSSYIKPRSSNQGNYIIFGIDNLQPNFQRLYHQDIIIGHLNLLKKAKENCDYLIVGITTDELIYQTKKKMPLLTLTERMEIIKSLIFVDKVVIQDDLDKVKAWKKYHFNKLFSGDDWKNSPRWKGYENELSKVGVETIYFPYTKNISSSKIRDFINRSF